MPGSHKGEIVAHADTFSEENFLYRGQEAAVEIDEEDVRRFDLGERTFAVYRLDPDGSVDRIVTNGGKTNGASRQFEKPSARQIGMARGLGSRAHHADHR